MTESTEAKTIEIPDAALEADIAILGKKGRGKTYTAKGVVERLLKMNRRVLVLDPLSTWWGLKSNAAGTGPGFSVAVFGGPHADMPLSERAARPLARVIAENNLPAVIDMGEMRKAAWQRLVRDLLDELFTVNRDPLWIVLEEADVFAPQQPREGDSTAVLGEVDRIARRGRAYGFRLISITQRPARLHKDVLTQLSTLVALGMTSPQDRDAIKAWVDGNADRDQAKEVMASLAKLPVGEGWLWAPDYDILDRVRFPPITTLDTSATPMAGDRRIEPTVLARVDLTGFTEALAEVDEPATTPTGRAANANEIKSADARGYQRGREEGYWQGGKDAQDAIMRQMRDAIDRIEAGLIRPAAKPEPRKVAPTPPSAVTRRSPATGAPSAARRMIEVLDTDPPIRMSWPVLCGYLGIKARGGNFNAARKWLRDNGKVIETNGLVQIAAPSSQAPTPPTLDEMLDRWQTILPKRAGDFLGYIRRERVTTKTDIAAHYGLAMAGGNWNSAWKALRDNDLIEESDSGASVALNAAWAAAQDECHD